MILLHYYLEMNLKTVMETYERFPCHCKDMVGSWLWCYDSAYTPRTANKERERESVMNIHIFVISSFLNIRMPPPTTTSATTTYYYNFQLTQWQTL